MNTPLDLLTRRLLESVADVRRQLGLSDPNPTTADARFSDLLDSMAMVEFLLLAAQQCGTTPEALEKCVGHRFGTIAELAAAMRVAGYSFVDQSKQETGAPATKPRSEMAGSSKWPQQMWLCGVAAELPSQQQHADDINRLLQRPAGWLQTSAGIERRHIWGEQDALAAAADAAREALRKAGVSGADVEALLVTSEAPPLLVGLAAALHDRLGLGSHTFACEVGGACTGFVAALWLARSLLPRSSLIVAVEAPSQFLAIQPGASGEAAALFGDAAAACLVASTPRGNDAVAVRDVRFGVDGSAAALIQVQPASSGAIELRLQGEPLARKAIRTMAQCVRDLANDHGLPLTDLAAVIMHGGNGRMPDMLARQLDLPSDRVWSETAHTGNLGSASLPVAWARHTKPNGRVAWAAVGAGLTWGAILTE